MSNQNSPPPGTPQTATKAYAATAISFVTIVLSAWIADNGGVTAKEVGEWVLLGLVGSGITGGATWRIPNKAKT